MSKIPLIVIVGPTASGKTALGVELARKLDSEVVSADSMQVYKRMDIGTAKPTVEEKKGVPHHMLDVVEPWENFSVADYTVRAHECIAQIAARGRIPVVVGGTGLYIRALTQDIDFSEGQSDPKYRQQLQEQANREGNEPLYELLKRRDPPSAQRIHLNDTKRIIRALEVLHVTGITMTEHQARAVSKPGRYEPVKIGLSYDREKLYDRINRRVDRMLEDGLADEVLELCREKIENSTAMQGIGYKEMVNYLKGECSLFEAAEAIKRGTRRYAKRQMTFFRADSQIHWADATGRDAFELLDTISPYIQRAK